MKNQSEKSDRELVFDYINGNEESLEIIILRYLGPLYNFVFRIIGGRLDTDDIIQEVFVKVWKKIGQYHHNQSFKTWLFAIAKNAAVDWLRKKRPLLFSEFEDDFGNNPFVENIADETRSPHELFELKEIQEKLSEALEKLRPSYRAVISLRYEDNFTFDEIGVILGKPLNTVKSQCNRAILELQTILANNAPK